MVRTLTTTKKILAGRPIVSWYPSSSRPATAASANAPMSVATDGLYRWVTAISPSTRISVMPTDLEKASKKAAALYIGLSWPAASRP
ncbi:Uncharacterised protein [Mycobacteroides abscessus subsp. abscessus]|nr:Uncharacterised protein [Mycobacteroides abscessus subsp. abscessus]